jgi:hypothetical protein
MTNFLSYFGTFQAQRPRDPVTGGGKMTYLERVTEQQGSSIQGPNISFRIEYWQSDPTGVHSYKGNLA